MTEQEIRSMKPGPEMDRTLGLALGYEEILVHEDLERRQKSEHERGTIIRYGIRYILRRKDQPAVEWSPSTSWEGMGLVVEELRKHYRVDLLLEADTNYCSITDYDDTIEAGSDISAPHAVAKAALLALRGGASG
ncbi:hypothetical protein P4H70_23245 [Paenibacillus ehimensis]|uniref:hypothetical protein n=1 Tax=Paenibacillus ehimensis TaxID=79264 RepID=UPI002DBF8092|nr:hypothetical protein [Paenibacillus ehimensis]MEC0211862.1 hypothetical protein [Paenibacillus ehimensis]